MDLGFTWSHRYAQSLGINNLTIPDIAKNNNWKWVRLGCYWNEIEIVKGKYNWIELDKIVNQAQKLDLKIILTVGSKAPRWPEFYTPEWLIDNELEFNLLQFINAVVIRYKYIVNVWQVENEPLDPSGTNHSSISVDLLKKEIQTIRSIDREKPIIINIWANDKRQDVFVQLKDLDFDILGLDWYPWQLKWKWLTKFGSPTRGSQWDPVELHNEINTKFTDKKIWISELQIEPWIEQQLNIIQKEHRAWTWNKFELAKESTAGFSPEVILVWGMEYWAWRQNTNLT